MNKYVYVTPNWEEYGNTTFGINNEGKFEEYTDTFLYILNKSITDVTIQVHFYNHTGIEYDDMKVLDLVIPGAWVWKTRVKDIIVKDNPTYTLTEHSRRGWIKIISSDKLLVSGKIVTGTLNTDNIRTEDSWSIPFFESPFEPIGKVMEPIDLGNEPIDPKNPFGGKIPRPFPR